MRNTATSAQHQGNKSVAGHRNRGLSPTGREVPGVAVHGPNGAQQQRSILEGWLGSSWQPLRHPPRRLWVHCLGCGYSAINEDRSLRGWQETTAAPRRYRCSACSPLRAGAADPSTLIAFVALHDSAARVSTEWPARRAELRALLAGYLRASLRVQLPGQATGTTTGQPVANATVGPLDRLQQTLTLLERALAPRQRRIERDSNGRMVRLVDEEIAGSGHGQVVRGMGR